MARNSHAPLPPAAPGARPTPAVVEPYERVEGEEFDLRSLLDVLLRGRWIIAAATALVVVPVLLYNLFQPSVYSSYSLLLIDKENSSLADIFSPQQAGGWWNATDVAAELLILSQSYPLAESAAQRLLQMERVPGTDRPLGIVQHPEEDRLRTAQEVAFALQEHYVRAAQAEGDVDAVRVTAVSTDPAEAALIANVYSDAFVDLTRESSRAGISASREFLEGQVEEQDAALRQVDAQVEEYMLREEAVALDEEQSQIVERIASTQADRDAAEVRIRTVRARMAAIEAELRRLEPQLGERLGSGLDAELETAQARVQQLIDQLDAYYAENPELRSTDAPPDYIATLQRELERARARVQQLSDRLARQSLDAAGAPGDPSAGFVRASALRAQLADLRVEVQGLEAQRDQLSARLADYEGELSRIPRQSIELAQLQRQRMATEQLTGELVTNLQEAQVMEQSQLGYAKPIRPAFESDEPMAPKRLRNVFLALVFGLFLGSALAIAKVRLDHRIHRPDDVRDRGFPLIGTVPDTTELIARDFDGQDTVRVDGREIDSHVITMLNPMAASSEAYRALRTSIQFSRPDVVVETVLVTSSNPGEGKSTTAANLAVVMAQAGRRTLLVDADLRKPTGHRKFGLPREPGFVQLLFDDAPFDPASLPMVADDLWVLTAGTLAPNPSELLGSKRMRELLEQLREHFDIIIFDAPPVLAATDAVLLSTQVDATLLVARAGMTKDYDLDAAMDALLGVGASVIGTVLNGFDVSNAYGYRYKYAYRYGSDYAYGSEKA